VRAVGYYQMTGEQENAIQQALPVVLRLFFSGILVTPEIPPEEATV
jgi:hypothetical protein